eukprot:gene6143-2752_t
MLSDQLGNPKGYAYIEFFEVDAVANAILLDNTELRGRNMKTELPGSNMKSGALPHHVSRSCFFEFGSSATLALWRSATPALCQSGALPLRRSATLALCHSGALQLRRCATLALCHSGAVPLWGSASLALCPTAKTLNSK